MFTNSEGVAEISLSWPMTRQSPFAEDETGYEARKTISSFGSLLITDVDLARL
jgi:hypothetical protein